LKISIITPEGEKLNIEADYWEFSQNKFIGEDVVLVFYKDVSTEKEQPSEEPDKISKPSRKGILPQNILSNPLKNVIGEEQLSENRNSSGVVFVTEDKPFISLMTKKIVTEKYNIDNTDNINIALKEFIKKEKELSDKYQIQILKEPIVKFYGDEFNIEEEINVGKEKTEVQ
jgi:hypothetical protein